jgi:hypothetical protein
MATGKLIGSGSVSADATEAPDYFTLNKFTAEATGTVTEIKIYCGGATNVKVAIYENSGGEPGALLNAVNTSQACVAGWNTIAFPSTPVTNGVEYWLAMNQDAHQVSVHYATGQQRRWKAATYSSFSFPNPAGSGFTTQTTVYQMQAGWGSVSYDETGKLQVVLAAQGEADHQAMDETAKLQVVLAAQGEADSPAYLELSKEQVILAVLGEADAWVFIETGKLQVVLAAQGEADAQAMVETARLQVVLAAQGITATQAMVETARLQVVLAAHGEAEHLTLSELSREQVILAVLGEADQYGFIETGKLQVILAQIGISTVWNLQKARLQGAVRNLPSARELEAL